MNMDMRLNDEDIKTIAAKRFDVPAESVCITNVFTSARKDDMGISIHLQTKEDSEILIEKTKDPFKDFVGDDLR